eukprot:TRINITY_DN68736_c0_g1_i1.p1 TRINITY_DN68736_c0_g1~~TRINITY_DN68736_c0_g1_i1.p1  ORF type:complete len:623 (+),score=140.16 TRINITY_DN68736_c0_g1_i1:227-2095(+)
MTIPGDAERQPLVATSLKRATDVEAMSAPVDVGIRFEDITVSAHVGGGCSKGSTVDILHGISGECRPGEVCAILGPSGSGKTTLLNVLAGRIGQSAGYDVGGSVYFGSRRIEPVKWRTRIAYVMQDDSLHPTTTVRETFAFSALLRLPASSAPHREEIVDNLVRDLGLARCADTIVGNVMIRGISGGERKRTAVGIELVAQPSILFLDEPLSGLDSHAAFQLVRILCDLAHARRIAVVMTVHQPSSELFSAFDSTIFLANGRVAYRGPPAHIPAHFASVGRPCPPQHNPADHVLFVVQTLPERDLAALVEASPAATSSSASFGDAELPAVRRRGIGVQLWALFLREVRNLRRAKASLIMRFAVTIFMNLLVAMIFKNAADPPPMPPVPPPVNGTSTPWPDPDEGCSHMLSSHFNVLVQLAISAMFACSQPTLLTFPLERPVFLREVVAGMYHIPTYFLAKMMVELPVMAVQLAVGLLLPYFVIGLKGNFALLLLAIWLLGVSGSSVALFLGGVSKTAKAAIEFTPLLFVPQMFFSGVFIPIAAIPSWLRWSQYVCFLKYAVNLMAVAEFRDLPLEKPAVFCSMDISDDWRHILLYYGVIVALIIVFRSLAVIGLTSRARSLY